MSPAPFCFVSPPTRAGAETPLCSQQGTRMGGAWGGRGTTCNLCDQMGFPGLQWGNSVQLLGSETWGLNGGECALPVRGGAPGSGKRSCKPQQLLAKDSPCQGHNSFILCPNGQPQFLAYRDNSPQLICGQIASEFWVLTQPGPIGITGEGT